MTVDERRSLTWTREPPKSWPGDARGLARELTAEIGGEVRFDVKHRGLYATDASNYRQVPIGVVYPRDAADVESVVTVCRRHGAPILGRGGGTSLAGQCCNLAVILDFSRHMNRVLEIDPDRRLARVEPGVVLDGLRAKTLPHGLSFGPDPATHDHCTLGGMIGNNSCGVHSVMAGRTADNVRSLEVLTYDGLRLAVGPTSEAELAALVAAGGRRGELYRGMAELRDRYGDAVRRAFPDIPRRVSGYNLDELLPERGFQVARALVGSEGTLALTLEATLELVEWPAERVLLVAAFEDVYTAAVHVPEILELAPIGLEGLDDVLIQDGTKTRRHPEALPRLPAGGGWLLIEMGGGGHGEARARAEEAEGRLRATGVVLHTALVEDPAEQRAVWEVRESGLAASARVPGQADTWPGWEDSAVAPEEMGTYLRELRALLDRYGYQGAFYGHFGDGCLHTRISFDLTSRRGIEAWHEFLEEAADLALAHRGVPSGEHGDGQARGELLLRVYGPEVCRAFTELKGLWDPDDRMNPGKVARPYPITSNLRLGAGYRPWEPATRFAYPDDDGRFSRAALRCVGVGKCRRESGGTMCPSYRVTREEEHSTRGRARLLFEMLRGEEIAGGWRSEAVAEALDLCLSCKGCKGDCPVQVDMATYKAEFLHHHYRRRLRSRPAYSMGRIDLWARLAARAPRLVNAVTQGRLTGRLVKALGGIAPQRPVPAFAPQTFRKWYGEHRSGVSRIGSAEQRILLWPDTFNDAFHPETAVAALEVLEAAGFRVDLPPAGLCCGRPLYDYGMLDLAERRLRRILDALREDIRAGVPIVGLEPSCVATFRDELPNLLPDDEDARRLSEQTYTLAELLTERAAELEIPRLDRRAIVQRHCHHAAVMGHEADREILDRLGLDVEVLDSGCCGMAGAFGYERGEKYRVSVAAGEQVLLPRIREADPQTLILADGFSCRSQIEQTTERRALHLAQVLQMALREGRTGPPGALPERDYVGDYRGERSRGLLAGLVAGLGAAALAAGGTALWLWRRRRR